MKTPLFVVLFLVALFSCEIEDDFGKPVVKENKGDVLASATFASRLIWYSSNSVVLFQNGTNGVTIVNVDSKSTSNVAPNTLLSNVFGVTSNGKLIATLLNQDYTYSLIAMDLGTEEMEVLSENWRVDGLIEPLISGDKVVYAEVSETVYMVHLYDAVTEEKKFINQDFTPAAISPDTKKLFGWGIYGQGIVYDMETFTYTSLEVPYDLSQKIFWNNEGITAFKVFFDGVLGVIDVHNYTHPEKSFTKNNVQSPSLFVSRDGLNFIYPTARCSNPNYTQYCYDGNGLISLRNVDVTSESEEEVALIAADINNAQYLTIGAADFSPDKTKIVYSIYDQLYVQPVPNQ